MRILFLGDIVGKNGREIIGNHLNELAKKYRADFIIANGENATHGKGLIENHYRYLLNIGIDAITLGNHYDGKNEIREYIEDADSLIRPLNIKDDNFKGVGSAVFEINGVTIRVTNLLGSVYMNEEVINPFDALDNLLNDNNEEKADIHIVDFHAEATGEKQALGYAFDGRVSAVLGTHTHVQTNDARIFENGTAFISDVGMCGPYNGILGCKKEAVIERTWHGAHARFETNEIDDSIICGVILDINEGTGRCEYIQSFNNVYKLK
ncbi:MAG: TIGR00282 family metallophosphoesterase [Bacilli bacterium]|nr:TIGR00282 family metallophosphoesterase [Bacilli bacterium]